MKPIKKIADQADWTAAACAFPYSKALEKKFKKFSRFGDQIPLTRKVGDTLLVPRQMVEDWGENRMTLGQDVEFDVDFTPRNTEQERVVAEVIDYLARGESGVVCAPTGFGKTVCSTAIYGAVGKKTAIVVHKEDLKQQWVEAAKLVLGLDDSEIGFVQGKKCEVKGRKLIICMIQSLSKPGSYEPSLFDDVGLVIWDETHRVGAETFSQTPWLFNGCLRLGVSATPQRRDGRDIVIWGHIGPIIVETEALPMIPKVLMVASGWHVPRTRVKNKTTGRMEVKQIPHQAGRLGHITKIMSRNDARNDKIVEFVCTAYRKDRLTIIFSDTKAHLDSLEELLVGAGVPDTAIGQYVGSRTAKQLEEAKGKPVILATYAMCSEGTDIPWLDCGVLATPKANVAQIVGRVLREYEDKKQPLILDLTDDDSPVFKKYKTSRLKWYKSIDAEVKHLS